MSSPRDIPIPPEALRFRVIGDKDIGNFLKGGQDTVADIREALRAVGKDLRSLRNILDFGCGCGRTLRSFAELSNSHHLYGSDFDAEAINWCKENLRFARFDVNTPLPPVTYASNKFDLIFALSVFTHLNEDYQFRWLSELRRTLRPGGILIISVHGRHYIDALPPDQMADVERHGFLFLEGDYWKGIFPEWYQNAFHTREYILEKYGRDFAVLGYLPQGLGNRQDIVIVQKRPKGFRIKGLIFSTPNKTANKRVSSPP